MLKAWVGILLLAEDEWFYSSPTPSVPLPSRNFGTSNAALADRRNAFLNAGGYVVDPIDGTYPLLDLDFRLCDFQLSTFRQSRQGCVVETNLLIEDGQKPDLRAMCKVVDVVRYPLAGKRLADEVRTYATLRSRQGVTIPRVWLL